MISIPFAAVVGAAVGAAALGVASAATGDITGLGVALGRIPQTAHGLDVVTAVSNALAGGTAGAASVPPSRQPPRASSRREPLMTVYSLRHDNLAGAFLTGSRVKPPMMKKLGLSLLAMFVVLSALAAIPARAATFPIDYSDPASDVVRLNATTGLCEVDAGDNCIMSPDPKNVNIQWLRGRDTGTQYNLTIEVRGLVRDYANTSYIVNLYTDASNRTHWSVNYTNGVLLLYTNVSTTQRTDISGNATIWGLNPTAPNSLSLFLDKALLGGPTNISASVNIDGTAVTRGDPSLGQPYSYQDFGWEVPGHPATSPTLLHGHVYVKGTTTPIAGANVALSGGQSVVTNATGFYEFSLSSGTYNVTVSANGYVTTKVSVTLTLGQTLTRDVELEPNATLSGSLLLAVLAVLIIGVLIIVAVAVWRRKRKQTGKR